MCFNQFKCFYHRQSDIKRCSVAATLRAEQGQSPGAQERETERERSAHKALALFHARAGSDLRDWLTRPMLGSQRRCHAAAHYPALAIVFSFFSTNLPAYLCTSIRERPIKEGA